MKIAGRKNPGAWFRANKAIQKLSDEERANLAGIINLTTHCEDAFNAIVSLIGRAGVTTPVFVATQHDWCNKMCDDGIPLQVWMGRLSWTTYTKEGDKYYPEFQNQMRRFGKEIRAAVTSYFMTRRQLRDLGDFGGPAEGNPGGLPDGNPAT